MSKNNSVPSSGIRKNLCTAAVLLISAIILFYFAVQNKNHMAYYDDIIPIHLRDAVTGKQAEKIQNENTASSMPYSFTLWGEKPNTRVRNSDLLRETEADCIKVCGRTDLLFSSGCVLEQSDTTGCLLDADTAYALFGGSNAVNQRIQCDNRTYVVRGMLENTDNVIVIQAAGDEDAALDTITVLRKKEPMQTTANNIFNMFRLQGRVMEFGTLTDITTILFLAVPVTLTIYLLLQINTYKKECITPPDHSLFSEPKLQLFFKLYPAEYWIWYLLQICLFLLFLFLICHNLSFTDDYIPTKWSDFDFWSSLIREKREGVAILFRMPKRKPEILYFLSFYKAIIFNLTSFFLLIMVIWEQKLITLKKMLIPYF